MLISMLMFFILLDDIVAPIFTSKKKYEAESSHFNNSVFKKSNLDESLRSLFGFNLSNFLTSTNESLPDLQMRTNNSDAIAKYFHHAQVPELKQPERRATNIDIQVRKPKFDFGIDKLLQYLQKEFTAQKENTVPENKELKKNTSCCESKKQGKPLHVRPAYPCDDWDKKTHTCWLNRQIGVTVTFSLMLENEVAYDPKIVWKQELYTWKSGTMKEIIIDPDMGFVYPGETLTINIHSTGSFPIESVIYKWHLESYGEDATLPSNMRCSTSCSSITIMELRKEQEGILGCSVYSNLGIFISKKRFLIHEISKNSDVLMATSNRSHQFQNKIKQYHQNMLNRKKRQTGTEDIFQGMVAETGQKGFPNSETYTNPQNIYNEENANIEHRTELLLASELQPYITANPSMEELSNADISVQNKKEQEDWYSPENGQNSRMLSNINEENIENVLVENNEQSEDKTMHGQSYKTPATLNSIYENAADENIQQNNQQDLEAGNNQINRIPQKLPLYNDYSNLNIQIPSKYTYYKPKKLSDYRFPNNEDTDMQEGDQKISFDQGQDDRNLMSNNGARKEPGYRFPNNEDVNIQADVEQKLLPYNDYSNLNIQMPSNYMYDKSKKISDYRFPNNEDRDIQEGNQKISFDQHQNGRNLMSNGARKESGYRFPNSEDVNIEADVEQKSAYSQSHTERDSVNKPKNVPSYSFPNSEDFKVEEKGNHEYSFRQGLPEQDFLLKYEPRQLTNNHITDNDGMISQVEAGQKTILRQNQNEEIFEDMDEPNKMQSLSKEIIKEKYRAEEKVSQIIASCHRNTQCSNYAICVRKPHRLGHCKCAPNYHGNGIFCWEDIEIKNLQLFTAEK
ncbi:uncharacterized protein LOC118197753 isoform X2 [Stegodyphus dumicola]|uniref:uncharacterized protein LOC118197753 isoform X2 n=1 Tax=Stegodyphus dumicola TaxID=202533 RepID=UPI0015AC8B78|nr:uncharacterized protein LOC118197753 isoform X2 [Stegodyphus dumicola]